MSCLMWIKHVLFHVNQVCRVSHVVYESSMSCFTWIKHVVFTSPGVSPGSNQSCFTAITPIVSHLDQVRHVFIGSGQLCLTWIKPVVFDLDEACRASTVHPSTFHTGRQRAVIQCASSTQKQLSIRSCSSVCVCAVQ